MLKKRTSSSTQLRIQTSLRHNIRNLRAKVRSILPQQGCSRQLKRNQSAHNHPQRHQQQRFQLQLDRKISKQFDKLTLKELQQINSNKHYFLGNDKAIAYYEQYLKDCHPQLIFQLLSPPAVISKSSTPSLSFIPFNLLPKRSDFIRKSKNSFKNFTEKRQSVSSMSHCRKRSLIRTDQYHQQHHQNRQKAEACLIRKQDLEEQKKIRRQINLAQIQRQQHIAAVNRDNFIKEKVQSSKSSLSASTFFKNDPKHNKKLIEEYEVAELTSKLRKICLQRKRQKAQGKSS